MVVPRQPKRGRRYWKRLLLFLLIVIFAFPLVITLAVANAEALSYVVPAHTTINRPADLPPETQDVSFIGADNLTLRGWYIPPKNGHVIILLHGYFLDRTQMLFHAHHLSQAGFGALLYDERGAGESDGDRRSFGWGDVADVGGALDFLKDKAASISISGCSIGGQIALRAAAQYPQIRAVLADGPSIVTADDFPPAGTWQESLLLSYYHLVDRLLELHTGMAAPPALMMTINHIAPRPIMLFAGANSSEKLHIQRYQQAAGANAQYWEIPAATHCDGPTVAPEEYAHHMIEFFTNS